MEAEYTANIIILGAPASGKKSFIRRYCEDIFTDLYDPITETSGDRRLANISGIATLINLERIPSIFIQSASETRRIEAEADALILLYDGSSPESLEELQRMQLKMLAPEVREGDEARPIAVVASKADLAEAADTGTGTGTAWEQGIGEGSELAVQLGARFGVTSALWGDGVKDVVEELAARVLEMKGVEKEVLMGAGS
ncbi:hypothetical protein FAVG1_00954 [Fusarium avenaceum]|nr:hypothetical protein FAVG1_00954 [Fusarium avenaceum]